MGELLRRDDQVETIRSLHNGDHYHREAPAPRADRQNRLSEFIQEQNNGSSFESVVTEVEFKDELKNLCDKMKNVFTSIDYFLVDDSQVRADLEQKDNLKECIQRIHPQCKVEE